VLSIAHRRLRRSSQFPCCRPILRESPWTDHIICGSRPCPRCLLSSRICGIRWTRELRQ